MKEGKKELEVGMEKRYEEEDLVVVPCISLRSLRRSLLFVDV